MEKKESGQQPFSYLCIEGVIGAGKTSLCRLLSKRLNARGLYEEADENPFLGSFYQDRHSYAFQTQVWFLLSRYRQLSEAGLQQDLFHPVTVADYMFAKDKIFATINLDENELALYSTIAQTLETKIPRPDYVVYLQVSTEVLLKRIEMRGRDYETNISPSYIAALNEAYNHFFFHYTQSPLLILNTNEIDFVNNPDDFEEIYKQIINIRHGSAFYHPLGSGKNTKNRKDRIS